MPRLESVAGQAVRAEDHARVLDAAVGVEQLGSHRAHPGQAAVADQLVEPLRG